MSIQGFIHIVTICVHGPINYNKTITMAKFLYSFNWNIDTRAKLEYTSRKTETFTPVQTEYGTITAVDNPYNSYMRGHIAMFRIALNNESTARILNGIDLKTCTVEEINMYAGLCGMLTIEIFGSTSRTSDECTFRELYNNDMIAFANHLPYSTKTIAEIVQSLESYTDKTDGYSWGQPVSLLETGLTDASESYIYTYNLFTDKEAEKNSLLEAFDIKDDSLNVKGNKVWQAFANYIWQTAEEVTSEIAHVLNFSYIPAAWEVLIYDSGTICCKNFLRCISNEAPVKTGIIRNMISRDNLILLEVELSEREQEYDQHLITIRSKQEYGLEHRRHSFATSQSMLKYAINGIESSKQQYISRLTGIILAFLTALSVYSVFSDIYNLITSNSETLHFNNISTMMLTLATIIMVIVLYLTTRKEEE